MAKRPIGRPMKYKEVILALNDQKDYTPASIADFAKEKGFLEGEDIALARQRIRIALGRFSNNHNFPDEGDAVITRPGQAPTPSWMGWRWKGAIYE